MQSRQFVCAIAASLCLSGVALSQDASSRDPLRSLLEIAVASNRELAALQKRFDEASGLRNQAAQRPSPVLQTNVSTGRPLATVGEEIYSAGLSQRFERGNKRGLRIDVADLQAALAQAEYRERLRQLFAEIKIRYLEATSARLGIAGLDDLLAANREALDVTRARVERGDAAAIDQTLIEVEIGRTQAQRASLQGRLASAMSDLRRLSGLAPSNPIELGPELRVGPQELAVNALVLKALTTRPDLELAQLVEQRGAAELNLAIADGIPDITVSAGYSRTYGQFDDQLGFSRPGGPLVALKDRDDILSVGISLPLFTKRRNTGNIEAAQARNEGATLRVRYMEAAIPLEVQSAYERWTSALEAIRILDQFVLVQAQGNLDIIRQAYEAGEFRLLDVIQEQRKVLEARLAAIDAQAEAARSFAELERAVGEELQ